ncbi:hypothetical protein [Sphingobium cloacae]|uniref:Uncharacterized protein n=1 Tax=Sphingobium cloacae TaxID=120107 RepID=A0A1E1F444_9SPHN|nr:hypothetical protein [Sphingobium cloacae]BAV65294.1 hypothetical protein SCLO_1022540 [Sphingobium cloacae]
MDPTPSDLRKAPLFGLLIAAAALPVLLSTVPGLADLPNHVARHHIFHHFGEGGPLDRFFDVQWRWIGNLGVDLPVMGLMRWLDAETATRLVVACIAPLTVAAMLLLSHVAHGRVSASAMLALPFAFHQAYLYGFVNYCLGVALAMLVLAAFLRRPPRTGMACLLFAAASILVWTAHLGGWFILVVAAGCAELTAIRSWRGVAASVPKLLPLAAPVIPLLLWRGASFGPPFAYVEDGLLWAKVMNFVTVLKGWSRYPDLIMTGSIGLLALLAICWAGGRRFDPRLLAAGVALCLGTVIMPTTVLGSWGADFRLAPVAGMFLLLSIGPAADPKRERMLFIAGALIFAVRVAGIALSWNRASAILEQRLIFLDDVPRGSRMGFLAVRSDCRHPWALTPDHKVPGLAIARRDAFTNTMFKVEGADLMTIRDPRDRARWFDLSENVEALCPAGKVDRTALAARLGEMARDRFDRIWLWGASPRDFTVPAGYEIRRIRGEDVLLGRTGV